jgi:hypothetical protein
MFRISQIDKTYQTETFSSTLTHIIPFNDNYIWAYFANGFYQVWELSKNVKIQEAELEKDIACPVALSEKELVYCSTQTNKLQVLNIISGKVNEKFQRTVPTSQALPEIESTVDKLKTMWNDGISLITLPESRIIVLLEKKRMISSSNDSILTCFHDESENYYFQTTYTNQYHRELYLAAVRALKKKKILYNILFQLFIHFFSSINLGQ